MELEWGKIESLLLSPMACYGHSNVKPTVTFGCACGTQGGLRCCIPKVPKTSQSVSISLKAV